MTPRQAIFISAVSKELKGPRQLVANTLQFLGYEPVWQDIFGTEQGDLRAMLRRQIDGCKGVVQLVGQRYGAEPPVPDEQFGRVSYTQYEALYARRRGKKVWYLLLDESFPSEKQEPEPEELRQMQAAYRRRLQADSHLFHPLNSPEALEADVLKLRDDLTRLRRGAKQWAAAVVFLLVILVGAAIWLMSGQRQLKQQNEQLKQQNAETQKNVNMLRQYVEAAIKERQEQPGQTADELQRQTDEKWAKQRGVTPKELRQEMLRIAQEVKNAPDVSTYERANAAYVTKDYNEAERLALAAVDEAEKASPPKISAAIKALELAGNSAVARTEYADALRHLRGAEKLTDRQRNPREWADVQFDIGGILYLQGNFKEAAAVAREELNERSRWAGSENLDTLCSRNNLAADLERISGGAGSSGTPAGCRPSRNAPEPSQPGRRAGGLGPARRGRERGTRGAGGVRALARAGASRHAAQRAKPGSRAGAGRAVCRGGEATAGGAGRPAARPRTGPS
jgi:hypothetical protein